MIIISKFKYSNYKNNRHYKKFCNFIYNDIKNIKNPKILEFGVSSAGLSTSILLDLCEKNKLSCWDNNVIKTKELKPEEKMEHKEEIEQIKPRKHGRHSR